MVEGGNGMQTLKLVNAIFMAAFVICYAYQFFYIPVPWLKKEKARTLPAGLHSYAVLICARNEAAVIGDLIDSLHAQTYEQSLIRVFVMADNCTDETAGIARAKGVQVYERWSTEQVGKGYALQALRQRMKEDYPEGFDGYFVFDADNILKKNYIEEMNRTFSQGHDLVTSYRNSKNYADNWISAGYALWFLRESRYLNHARSLLGTSCAVSGTGFLFSRKVADEIGDWPFHLLTEDLEFTVNQITKGRKIAFCAEAEFYDEQPVSFLQSWRQRQRWTKGYIQIFAAYWKQLFGGMLHGSWSCFDFFMSIMPALVLSLGSLACNIAICIWGGIAGQDMMIALYSAGELVRNMYLTLLAVGLITTISEWNHIQCGQVLKLGFCLTFPFFMFTYIPIAISAFFCKVEWKPIAHTVTVGQMQKKQVPVK